MLRILLEAVIKNFKTKKYKQHHLFILFLFSVFYHAFTMTKPGTYVVSRDLVGDPLTDTMRNFFPCLLRASFLKKHILHADVQPADQD
jgi:hypothetical protein